MIATLSDGESKRTPAGRGGLFLRLFSSIWLGVTLLVVIVIYASVMSAMPWVRSTLELTEMQAFRHWLFDLLVVLFCINLTVATLRRIRFNTMNLGVWMVHTGLIMLVVGCWIYFATKVEGDLILFSPRVELVTADGKPVPNARVLAQAGESWETFMPAMGGAVHLHVDDVKRDSFQPVSEARVTVHAGETDETVTLTRERPRAMVSDRFGVRLVVSPPETHFYDDETPVIYYREIGGDTNGVASIKPVPMFRERYLDEGYVLTDRDGEPYPSRRTRPEVKLAGLTIPTGWFEQWRLPIPLRLPDGVPFDAEVTGYVPYAVGVDTQFASGGGKENPALQLTLEIPGQKITEWLAANDPKRSILETAVPFEFRWVANAAERDAILKPLAGPHELYIEVRDPPVQKTVSIHQGDVIEVEGTPYKLTIKQLSPSWPLMTPGFEGARSPMASVDVTNGEKSYNRTVIQRFPHLSQDIDETGKRHRDGPYDANLILRYRTCASQWVTIVAGPGVEPQLGIFQTDGSLETQALAIGRPQEITLRGVNLTLTPEQLITDARPVEIPILEPRATRRPNLGRNASAVRLTFTGRGELSGWKESRWVFFSQYPHVDVRPIRVRPPGAEHEWEFKFSRAAIPLGAEIAAGRLSVELFPGGRNVERWRSDYTVRYPDGAAVAGAVYTNQTDRVGKWTLFQSGAAADHWSYTILGVGNRRGIWTMTLACVLITVGCMYAFYVKPILRKRKMLRALEEVRRREASGEAKPAVAAEPELAEV
ncbi:MAG: hypothetical protein D6744_02185 [Planctomycetota bacterium]|nr:MAG: hypothetical protein D6744_02185 [Planctomycetota bacterium]